MTGISLVAEGEMERTRELMGGVNMETSLAAYDKKQNPASEK
jgi:hypothetical protein